MFAGHHSDSTPDSRCVPILCTTCLRVVTLTEFQTAGVFLSCVHDYRAFGTVQAVHKTTNNRWQSVVISHELVSCGNRGNSDAVVEWIPAAMLIRMLVQFAYLYIFCARSSSRRVQKGGKHRASPPDILIF